MTPPNSFKKIQIHQSVFTSLNLDFKRVGRKIKVMYPEYNRKSRKYSESES